MSGAYDLGTNLVRRIYEKRIDAPAILDAGTHFPNAAKFAAAWQDIRDALHADGWDGIKTIVLDSATRAEELAVAHTLASVPHEKGQRVQRIEDYGFGKGYSHVYDTFLTLLGDLDQHTRAGRHVVPAASGGAADGLHRARHSL